MNCSTVKLFKEDPWLIIEEKFDPGKNKVAESIFSLANEYMGTRGIFEEGLKGNTLEGCYVGGMYFKEKTCFEWKRVGFPSYMNSMAHTTNWLKIIVEVDGEAFQMDSSKFESYSRTLDMKTAVLCRELVFVTGSGHRTQLRWERFLSLDDRRLGAQKISIKALNHQKTVSLSFQLDATKGNQTEVTKTGIHSDKVSAVSKADEMSLIMKIRSTGQYYIHHMVILKDPNLKKSEGKYSVREKTVECMISFTPEKGREYVFSRIVSVWNSRDAGYPHGLIVKDESGIEVDAKDEQEILDFIKTNSKKRIDSVTKINYDGLKARHSSCMKKVWDDMDVEINGDISAQQGIRYCLFQLLNTYRGSDAYLNIGAKGMTGEVYDGRAFWDTESYCVPFYLYTNPEAAKRLLEFRYNTLDAARSRARELRYQGAVYPFTTIDGTEDCVVWDLVFSEIHINAIIPFALYQYVRATGDNEYLFTKGAEVLVEQARFWADRACFIPYRDGYALNRVTGPDEWHIWTNNNFYTNYMAKWVLEYAAQVVDRMSVESPQNLDSLVSKITLDPDELFTWRQIAGKMILNYDEKFKIFPQDDMFLSMEPFTREQLDPEKDIPIERHWTVEKWYKTDMVKQPDTLLAIFFHRDKFTIEQKRNNYRFYEQRTAHSSSLSPCIHSILACEIGRYAQAYAYYLWASRLDLDDLNKSTHEGLHISSMAGSWANIVFGFGGMSVTDESISFNPIVPEDWKDYSFRVAYKGSVIQVKVDKKQAIYQIARGNDVKVQIKGKDYTLTGKSLSVPLDENFLKRPKLQAVIFDLDGVIVDTAKYHFLAWKELAEKEGIYFDERINERLKGVSRMDSLKIIMERSSRKYSDKEMEELADRKNKTYVKMLDHITPDNLLPGIPELLEELRKDKIKIALCSASKNSQLILEKLKVVKYFDVVVTGNDVKRSKPDPEGVLLAASKLKVRPENCVVVEDAQAGIAAAVNAGTKSMGIGYKIDLYEADTVLSSTRYLDLEKLRMLY
ncbi:MAG TPA: beta-phosphoglucomutase [Lentisphaeria bacterium]|nr:MAG: beta-phosphoglucomutase [Lentisphaerae bacterium GWF2_49_21]HBC87728.1 beta-phosphoglucomutase [Lentisphaeria bacterium]